MESQGGKPSGKDGCISKPCSKGFTWLLNSHSTRKMWGKDSTRDAPTFPKGRRALKREESRYVTQHPTKEHCVTYKNEERICKMTSKRQDDQHSLREDEST